MGLSDGSYGRNFEVRSEEYGYEDEQAPKRRNKCVTAQPVEKGDAKWQRVMFFSFDGFEVSIPRKIWSVLGA